MSIFWGLDHYSPSPDGVVATIGTFDGVHLGHQELLQRAIDLGRQFDMTTVAVTFDRHPLEVVAPERLPKLLQSSRDRAEKLAASGVNRVVVLQFDAEFASIEPGRFVQDTLVDRIGMKKAVVGHNFRFGHSRSGTPELLQYLGLQYGFDVEIVQPRTIDEDPVSSTQIRTLIAEGEIEKAARMLGRYYKVSGQIVQGAARGRVMGFPTANVNVPDWQLVPANGVYAVNGRFNGLLIRGAANIGTRPTIDDGAPTLEVHLIGYEGDLYDVEMEVEFLRRLRPEIKFDSPGQLADQIRADVAHALQTCDDLDSIGLVQTASAS